MLYEPQTIGTLNNMIATFHTFESTINQVLEVIQPKSGRVTMVIPAYLSIIRL